MFIVLFFFFFSSRRRHTRCGRDWSSDVCSSDLWAIDRLSILALKLYHMEEQIRRNDVEEAHVGKVRQKLAVLTEQRQDLSQAISELLEDIRAGRRIMKVYRQMKMYNDPSLNPILYGEVK